MLRLREWLEFKPSDTVGKFEVLVVSGSDRILGEMVREKRMVERKKEEIEYYKRKKAQKEKAEAEAKAKGGDGEKGKEKEKKMEKEKIKEGDKKKDKGEGEEKAKSDTSTKKVKDGKEIAKPAIDKAEEKEKEKGVEVEEGRLMVAIPVKTDGIKDLDAKHDRVAVLAAPGEAAAAEVAAKAKAVEADGDAKAVGEGCEMNEGERKKKEGEKEKAKEVRDPMRDAERIAKMMGNKGDLKMEDIQIALKVLEAASGMSPSPSSLSPAPSHPLAPSSPFLVISSRLPWKERKKC
jgi:hypothetical protein